MVKTELNSNTEKKLNLNLSPKAVDQGPEAMLIDDQLPTTHKSWAAVQSPARMLRLSDFSIYHIKTV